MSETTENGRYDEVNGLIDALVSIHSDPGETVDVMPTTDAEAVIKAQLTENTGSHLLDSGMYGRHWEENQESPPWEQPRWDLTGGFPTENVYHRMRDTLERDRAAVALEAVLYAYGRHGPGEGDAWLTCMEEFAETHADPHLAELGDALGDELTQWVRDHYPHGGVSDGEEVFTVNTYNSEFAGASQVLQMTGFGGPYCEYVMVQVHGGADVRGGYTAPRVYRATEGPAAVMGSEFFARCERCGWDEAESCMWDTDAVMWNPDGAGELADRLAELTRPEERDGIEADAKEQLEAARDDDDERGACFHVGGGCGGRVHFM